MEMVMELERVRVVRVVMGVERGGVVIELGAVKWRPPTGS